MITNLKLRDFKEIPSGDGGNGGKKIHPHKFTLWVAIASILMMFAGLTSAFIVKSNLVGWRDIQMPKVFLVSTVVIILSSLMIQMSLRSFRQREMKNYRMLMGLTVLLGTAFVVLQWMGFKELWDQQNITFKGVSGAGQFLYVIFGLHALHVMGGIVALVIISAQQYFGKSRSYNSTPIEVMSTYWHFVDLLWLYLLVFFIWIG